MASNPRSAPPRHTNRDSRGLYPPLLFLSLFILAPGLPSEPLSPATRQHYAAALRYESAGDWRRAAAAYGLVAGAEPSFVPAILGMARAMERAGDTHGAVSAFGKLPAEPEAVRGLLRILGPGDPERAVALARTLTRLEMGSPDAQGALIDALLRVDPAAARAELPLYLGLLTGPADGALLLRLAVALRGAGDADSALTVLRQSLDLDPDGPHVEEARGRLQRLTVEQAAQELAIGGGEPLPAALSARLERAREHATAGSTERALQEIRAIILAAPRSAEAYGALGEVRSQQGEIGAAEQAFATAAALAPMESTWHARLGLLLAEHYAGRRHREAAEELTVALALRPTWGELLLELGRVHREQRDWGSAESAFQAYLAVRPEGEGADRAHRELAALTRDPPPPISLPAPPEVDMPAEVRDAYRVARVYLDRGELNAADRELVALSAAAPDWTPGMNLAAALALRRGDRAAAAAAWERSLALAPDQPRVALALGELRLDQGDAETATRLLQSAAAGGVADAHLWLARVAADEHRLWEADAALSAYFQGASGGLGAEPARELQRQVQRRIRLLQAAAIGGGALVVGLPLVLILRRRERGTLADLVERAPESIPDLARSLSAIRHEVLKHNTTLLDEVAAALERGEHAAVTFAAGVLMGASGDPGVIARFEADLAALTRLGRRHGVRLDLRGSDPVLAPMWAAMQRLRRLEGALRRPGRAGSGTAGELRELSVILNETGYRALGRLLGEMGRMEITGEWLRSVDARVRAEPAMAGRDLPDLELDAPQGVPVQALVGDVAVIVANLLRNAYAAGAARLGVRLFEDDDPITGLEHAELRVCDDAPGALTSAMIHGRDIGRGLGLVCDLVRRHEGTIEVEHAAGEGWTKAVVVRLPRAEEPADLPAVTVAVEEA